jgi:hypothetical protein
MKVLKWRSQVTSHKQFVIFIPKLNIVVVLLMHLLSILEGAWVSVVVKALRYKSEGPGIDSWCRQGFFRGI